MALGELKVLLHKGPDAVLEDRLLPFGDRHAALELVAGVALANGDLAADTLDLAGVLHHGVLVHLRTAERIEAEDDDISLASAPR